MPEIGETLREARMRRRVDMTEVETATKIRGKYLRALENEEWDLLPGPTFVKTFLRTYAEYLGLDSRLLVEEYRQRYERPSTQDLTPFATARGRGRPGRRRRRLAAMGPVLVVGACVVLLLASLWLLGSWPLGDDEEPASPDRAGNASESPRSGGGGESDGGSGGGSQERQRRRPPRRVRLQLIATAPVYVCVVDAGGRQVIDEEMLGPDTVTRVLRSKRFLTNFGNNGDPHAGERSHVPGRGERGCDRLRAAAGAQAEAAVGRAAPGLLDVSVRAGIVVTGTEVLSGIIRDANGPWLAERLRSLGVQLAHVIVVGDRPADLRAALDFLSGLELVITTGGLGPTADDLTAEVVAEFAGRPLELDPELEERIWAIISALRGRWRDVSRRVAAGRQPQAGAGAAGGGGARAGGHRAGAGRAGRRRAVRGRPAGSAG